MAKEREITSIDEGKAYFKKKKKKKDKWAIIGRSL